MLVLTLIIPTRMFTIALLALADPRLKRCSEGSERRKAARARFVGVWVSQNFIDPSREISPRSILPNGSGYDFADDGTGNFIRFGAQKPFTWCWCFNGKLTITLAGMLEVTRQLLIPQVRWPLRVLTVPRQSLSKQVTKTSVIIQLKYKAFWRNGRQKGTIAAITYSSTKRGHKMRFKLKTRDDKGLISIMMIYVRYVGIAKNPRWLFRNLCLWGYQQVWKLGKLHL